MAETAISFLLENLVKFLKEHIDLARNAKEELNGLNSELVRMKGIIVDASNMQNQEEHFKDSMKRMREFIYEVEDTIDSYATSSTNKYFSLTKLNLAKMVIELRVKANKVLVIAEKEISNAEMKGSSNTEGAQGPNSEWIQAPREDNVVGLEDQTDTLIEGINDEANKEFDVFSIVGMPGLGKTTLAWKIYCDQRIQHAFPTLIWVYFSQDFNMKNVLLTILKKFNDLDISKENIDDLVLMVRKKLENRKFLLFIDDVWTTDAWKQIERFLPQTNKAGRVLMTTRDAAVAKYASRERIPHELEFLSFEKGLELLGLEIYNTPNKEFPSDLDTYAKLIVTKCGGLPLSIIVIGGMLRGESSSSKWKMIAEDVGRQLFDGDKEKTLKGIISLSYKNLPYSLRDCFLYLGMFPEDTEIPALKLTQLWIAEGFIEKTPNKSLEKTAQDNLKDLISRNLMMVEKRKINGEVKTCFVHDTVREFCQKEAEPAEQNLFQKISKSTGTECFEPSLDVLEQCHRLSIHSDVKEFFFKKQKLPKLRSFLCTSKEVINLEKKEIPCITEGFELIRVLDVSPIKFPSLPPKLCKLPYLRYLTFSFTESVQILPEAMGKLCKIQTLTVNTTHRTLEVKANIWDMLQLRHFKTKASIDLKDKDSTSGKGKGGDELQTLDRLSTASCTAVVFKKAKNLKTLGISGDLNKLDSDCLASLKHLENLKLMHQVGSESPLKMFPQKLPLSIKFLTLSGTNLDWDQMCQVGKFSKLEVLTLKNNAFVGDAWNAVSGGFLQLEFLYISHSQLQVWTASEGSFPKLRNLLLKNCEKLEGVPTNLVDNLTMLSMARVTGFAVRSAQVVKKKQEQAEGSRKTKRGKLKLIIHPGDL